MNKKKDKEIEKVNKIKTEMKQMKQMKRLNDYREFTSYKKKNVDEYFNEEKDNKVEKKVIILKNKNKIKNNNFIFKKM